MGISMSVGDHLKFMWGVIRESFLWSLGAFLVLLLSVGGWVYDHLPPAYQELVSESIRDMLSVWYYFLVVFLLSVIAILYRYIAPKMDIVLNEDKAIVNGLRTISVDLINYGPTQGNIVFRLEGIWTSDGEKVPMQRVRFQREGNPTPVMLSTRSPKRAFIARLDMTKPDSGIEIMTDPITVLDRGRYIVEVGLNPKEGNPRRRKYVVAVEGEDLVVENA
jgi:hypothetical protein